MIVGLVSFQEALEKWYMPLLVDEALDISEQPIVRVRSVKKLKQQDRILLYPA